MSARPRALVVFESMFGNTERVAEVVTRGLRSAGMDTRMVEVSRAPVRLEEDLDLLVVGGPTHAFGMSRASTREDAVRQGAPAARADIGLREWLDDVVVPQDDPPAFAAFDTRASMVRWLPKAAGPAAVRAARKRGLVATERPVAFLVEQVEGPLLEGEVERALDWGRHLGQVSAERPAERSRR